jgi:hypothetical protein
MKPKTKTYIIGDPSIRAKTRRVCRTVWYSVVYAFALIGVGNVLFFIWRLFAV